MSGDMVNICCVLHLSEKRPVRVSDEGHGAPVEHMIVACAVMGWAVDLGEPSQVSEGIESETVWPVRKAFQRGDRVTKGALAGRVSFVRADGTMGVAFDAPPHSRLSRIIGSADATELDLA